MNRHPLAMTPEEIRKAGGFYQAETPPPHITLAIPKETPARAFEKVPRGKCGGTKTAQQRAADREKVADWIRRQPLRKEFYAADVAKELDLPSVTVAMLLKYCSAVKAGSRKFDPIHKNSVTYHRANKDPIEFSGIYRTEPKQKQKS